jgi:hypothetical protein
MPVVGFQKLNRLDQVAWRIIVLALNGEVSPDQLFQNKRRWRDGIDGTEFNQAAALPQGA